MLGRGGLEKRRGHVGCAGGQRPRAGAELSRRQSVDVGLRVEEGLSGEEAGESRQEAADRRDGRGVVEVRAELQARQPERVTAAAREARQLAPAGVQVLRLLVQAEMLPLETLPPAQETPVLEHVRRVGIQRPVVALPRVSGLSGHLDETVVERQVVADGVLPRGELLPVVDEPLADEVADLAERESFLRALQDGHGDQSDVRVRGLHRRGSSELRGTEGLFIRLLGQ